ncbi:MAG: PAS domain-containing sensor histidine kinase [Desulfobacteraceae bacterium IS3]|nr:MAG: PAS domain-containing sensor histidine kinase [Desulfobacteraceae bacterium IS3]
MRTENEKEFLIQAIDAFKRKIVVISPDFRILAANQHLIELRGPNITGQLCYQTLYGLLFPCEHCPAHTVIETGQPTLLKNGYSTLHPEKLVCLYSYPIINHSSGEQQIDAVVMLDFDLPVLEGLEEKLYRTNAFLRNLILSSVDGVIAADMSGTIFIFNDAAATISGYSINETINRLNIRDVYPGDGAREIMKKLRSEDYGGKGKLKSCHVEVKCKGGEIIPISLNAAVVYEGDLEVATIGFFHDLRETLEMKARLEKTQMQLLQAEKMSSLGKLAAGVAHQLNNPLGGITLFTKLILEEHDLDESVRDDLNRILRDAQRCRDTVKELLEFARQTRYNIQPHDINKAISRTLFLLENQLLFQNISIEKDLDASLPAIPIDAHQINHALMNIILNAAQAMDGRGKLTVKTGSVPDENMVRIEISDTGPGIPDEVLSRIFEPFFTTKEEGKGTGLGLSLVYSIAENHGGTVSVKSKQGQGTVFIIELPIEMRSGKSEK